MGFFRPSSTRHTCVHMQGRMLSGTSTALRDAALSGNLRQLCGSKNTAGSKIRIRTTPFATAKPSGSRGKVPSPATRASPKKKLPEVSSVSKTDINVRPQTSQVKDQVDSTAASAKQGVNEISENAKEVVDNIAPSSANTRRSLNDQANSLADGIDTGAEALKDVTGSSTRSRREAQRFVDQQADSVKDGLDAGAEAMKDVVSDSSAATQNAVDDFQQRASVAADRIEDNFQDASRETLSSNHERRQMVAPAQVDLQEICKQGLMRLVDVWRMPLTKLLSRWLELSSRSAPRPLIAQKSPGEMGILQVQANSSKSRNSDHPGRRPGSFCADIAAPGFKMGGVAQAVDTTAAGIREARQQLEELQKPGPKAPYQSTPLTSLDSSPFESRPGPKPALDKQVLLRFTCLLFLQPELDEEGSRLETQRVDFLQSEYYKKRVLYCVAGLDRGFAANKSAVAEVEASVASLLSVTKPVVLAWAPEQGKETSTLADLNGTWRLIYSSAFAKGNAPSLPGYKLGQVYQGISAYASRLDNIVEFYSTLPLLQLPGLPPIEPVVTTATLKHYFESIGGSTVQIAFEDTEVKSTGGPNGILGRLPEISLPQLPEGLRPSRASRSSTFEVLYLDDELRITRGKLGELRVFLRT